MFGFNIVKKGYAKEEVEEYIKKNTVYNEDKLKDQKVRIDELKQTVERLNKEIARLINREDDVKNALISATEKSNELLNTSRMRYAIEGQRLKLFREKWTNYYLGAVPKNKESISVQLGKYDKELYDILEKEFGIKSIAGDIASQYHSETDRLQSAYNDNAYTDIINTMKRARKKTDVVASLPPTEDENGGAFSLEDALRPSQSLEELCKELGMIS